LYKDTFTQTLSDKRAKEVKEDTSQLQSDIQKGMQAAKQDLMRMADKNKKVRSDPEVADGAELRMREAQHQSLTDELFKAMELYNETQGDFKEKFQNHLIRQMTVVAGDQMSQEEIREAVESGKVQETMVFNKNMLSKSMTGHTIKATFDDIQSTHQDLMNLESSMDELQDVRFQIKMF
jgi:t-SNARE complex subunit (syntaxin)